MKIPRGMEAPRGRESSPLIRVPTRCAAFRRISPGNRSNGCDSVPRMESTSTPAIGTSPLPRMPREALQDGTQSMSARTNGAARNLLRLRVEVRDDELRALELDEDELPPIGRAFEAIELVPAREQVFGLEHVDLDLGP